MRASIIIRTFNEARHLDALLRQITEQDFEPAEIEIIVVDSGSTDQTLDICLRYDVRIITIHKADFSFGRSLNLGCEAASGDALVFISGHCIPVSKQWLKELIEPLSDGKIAYAYGAQMGGAASKFSEKQLFSKYYPQQSQNPQQGFFCNNANAALLKSVWRLHPFNEELTGLEDMHLARRLVENGEKISYVAEAAVYHLHDETWPQVKRRFERESIALQHIMPEIHISFFDFLRYFFHAVWLDTRQAASEHVLLKTTNEICIYRLMQFWGAYRGNHIHRQLSRRRKEAYFYPR